MISKRSFKGYLVVLLALTLIVLVACADNSGSSNSKNSDGNDNNSNSNAAGDTDGDTIKIGATLPLTGPSAATGEYVKDGYEYWVEQVNENGGLLGKKVELKIVDDKSDEAEAVSLLQNIISQDNVDLLLGGYPGTAATAQMAIAEQHNMVYVSMGGHMKSFEQGYDYSFGAPPLMGEWWYSSFFDFLETLPEDERPTKAAIITANNPVGQSVLTNSKNGLERLGIEIVVDELYDLPLDSAETLVNKAKQAGADIFFANGFFDDGVQTIRAIRSLDYQPKAILQGIGSLTPEWQEELGDEGDYIFSGTVMHPALPFDGVEELNEYSEEKYGSAAPSYFMFGYAWGQVLEQAVEGAGELDQEAIKDWLKSNSVSTVGGEFTFDEQGLPEEFSYTTQIIDGQPVLVSPADIATEDPVYPDPLN